MSQVLLMKAHAHETGDATEDAKWDESKHPRKHGQFAKKGTGTEGASGKGKKSGGGEGSGWKKWLGSSKTSSTKAGGAGGDRPAQSLAKWLVKNNKSVSDGQFSKMLRFVDRWGKKPSDAFKSVVGGGGGYGKKGKSDKGGGESGGESSARPWTKKWYSALQAKSMEHIRNQGIKVGSIVKSRDVHGQQEGRVLEIGKNAILIKLTSGNYAGSKTRITVTGTNGNSRDGVFTGSILALKNISGKKGKKGKKR